MLPLYWIDCEMVNPEWLGWRAFPHRTKLRKVQSTVKQEWGTMLVIFLMAGDPMRSDLQEREITGSVSVMEIILGSRLQAFPLRKASVSVVLATLKLDSTERCLMVPSDLNRVALPPLQKVMGLLWEPWGAEVAGASGAPRHL